jgi:16S rRNA processing protein RimM
MKILTEYPERLSGVDAVYVGPDYRLLHLERIRQHQTGLLVKFRGIADRNAAEELRSQFVYVHIDDAIPLEEGEVYLYQIEGMQVVTDGGEALGRLTDYIETGANDVYVVTTPEGDEVLLPAIPQVIVGLDVENKVMTVHLLEGLID